MVKFVRIISNDEVRYLNINHIIAIYESKLARSEPHTEIWMIDGDAVDVEGTVDDVYQQIQEALKDSRALLG